MWCVVEWQCEVTMAGDELHKGEVWHASNHCPPHSYLILYLFRKKNKNKKNLLSNEYKLLVLFEI